MYCIIFLCGSGWGGGESCSILFVFPIGLRLSAFKMTKNNATVII